MNFPLARKIVIICNQTLYPNGIHFVELLKKRILNNQMLHNYVTSYVPLCHFDENELSFATFSNCSNRINPRQNVVCTLHAISVITILLSFIRFTTDHFFFRLGIRRLPGRNRQGQSKDVSVGRSACGSSGYRYTGAHWSAHYRDQA